MENKAALRTRLRAARRLRGPAELARAGADLARHGAPALAGDATVAAYAAIRDEPPTQPLLDRLVEAGTTVWLPVLTPDGLAWGRYAGWAALAERDGLLEPTGDLAPPAAVHDVDRILAPALAVDRSGHRLGRGAGYYDRALAGVTRDRIIAVVFTDELLDGVPAEPHDVPVGAALTPGGFVVLDRPDPDL